MSPRAASVPEPSLLACMEAANFPLTMGKGEDLPETWVSIHLDTVTLTLPANFLVESWLSQEQKTVTQTLEAYTIPRFSSAILDTSNLSCVYQRSGQGPRSSFPQREVVRRNEKPHYVLYFLITWSATQIRWTQFSSFRDWRAIHLQAFVKLSTMARRTPTHSPNSHKLLLTFY